MREALHQTDTASSKRLILMYHRIAEVSPDPWSLCVSPQHFGEHLEVLRKHAPLVQVRELANMLQAKSSSGSCTVITFDDGYADNLLNAKPLLERYDVPATVFISAGYLGHERGFWWDELEMLFLRPGILPDELHLSINGTSHCWNLGEAAHYDENTYRQHRNWRTFETAPTSRQAVFLSVWQLLQPLSKEERQPVLEKLWGWAGAEPDSRPPCRPLSLEEVVDLAGGGLVEVGSHTMTHPLLPEFPAAVQQDEIERSKACLENILGRPVISFAYPHGAYTSETAALVRETGYLCACSTLPSAVERETDLFRLPRVGVQDWDGEEFARHLAAWWNGETAS
jgi:peptidoglycan/xylan/chitin deacetylase (PgdA/CDA1 family)